MNLLDVDNNAEEGNIFVTDETDEEGVPIAVVVNKPSEREALLAQGETLHLSHFGTCPKREPKKKEEGRHGAQA